MVARTRAELKAVWDLVEITNRPTGLIELGSAPHVPAYGQAYSARTLRAHERNYSLARKRSKTTGVPL
jgi:hypothetical protein